MDKGASAAGKVRFTKSNVLFWVCVCVCMHTNSGLSVCLSVGLSVNSTTGLENGFEEWRRVSGVTVLSFVSVLSLIWNDGAVYVKSYLLLYLSDRNVSKSQKT